MFSLPVTGRALGYQQILAATLASATNLTPPVGAKMAYIVSEASSVRWRDDGTAPTTTIGMLTASGGDLVYSSNLQAIQFIAATGSPILDVSYYGN